MGKQYAIITIGIVCWLVTKAAGLGTWSWEVSNQIGALVNLGFMTAIAAQSAYYSHQDGPKHFLDRWKESAKPAVFYAFALTAVMGIWYYLLAPGAIEQRKAHQIELVTAVFEDPTAFGDLVDEHPELQGKENSQLLSTQIENIQLFFSPVFYLGIAMMTWIFTGLALAVCFTVLMPRIWK